LKVLKAKKEKAERVAETLRARVNVQKNIQKIKREEEKNLHLEKVEILEEIEKEGEAFTGVNNLTNSNDF
jgi:hypothetical protein